jgi:hypothetical protein
MTIRMLQVALAVATLAFSATPAAADALPQKREVLGWVEYVEFERPRVRLKAKLDTGATTSSLNAVNLRRFRRGGVSWARFEVLDPDEEGNRFTFESPVVRTARIRRHDGLIQQRPVVKLAMCLGHVMLVRQFTLIDRSDFNYQVLVGRNFLRGHIVVDSAARFQTRPDCEWPDGQVADGGAPPAPAA